MAIAGTEWLILGAIAFLVMMFRPDSLVLLGRGVGKAVIDFKNGKSGLIPGEHTDLLTETAEKLGIRTEVKTPSKIIGEILARALRDSH